MAKETKATSQTRSFTPAALKKAYEKVLPELEAMDPDDLLPVNLDIMAAATTAVGVVPDLIPLRPRIAAELPTFNLERFDRLRDYAQAAAYAHTKHEVATQPPDNLRKMQEEAAGLRDVLHSDAVTLVKRGLINGDALRKLRGPVGYKNMATDLQMLVNVFTDSWPSLVGKCATSEADLERAAELVVGIVDTVGAREQGAADAASWTELRLRAYTMFMRAYDDARRAVIHLRWHEGDADDIAPSLYAGRSNGRRKEPAAPSTDTKPEGATPTPTPTPIAPAVGTTNGIVSHGGE